MKGKQTSLSPLSEPPLVRLLLITLTLLFLLLFVMLPVFVVFFEAFKLGAFTYFATFTDPYALAAIKLTIIVAIACLVCNLCFGMAASWAMTKFEFKGKAFIYTLIDLPFSVSPIIAGLIYTLLLGAQSVLGNWLVRHHLQIIFALPGLILVTVFVTLPFIARELIPLMEKQGTEEEEVALSLGAKGWQTYWRVTFPNIKWGLLYGLLLCNARAMGEFGGVSVVSGHIRGKTTTLPLYIEMLYNQYNYSAAFALASILTLLALITLSLKLILEKKNGG